MDPSNTTLTPGELDSGDAQSGDLLTVEAVERQTIYVLDGDVLVLPCGQDVGRGTLQDIEQHLGLSHILLTEGLDRPWILRKGVPLNPA